MKEQNSCKSPCRDGLGTPRILATEDRVGNSVSRKRQTNIQGRMTRKQTIGHFHASLVHKDVPYISTFCRVSCLVHSTLRR